MTRNETQETIRNRRSIRGLIGPELSEKEIYSLIELAVLAPAPHHTQPWRFAHISQDKRNSLTIAMGSAWKKDLIRDGVKNDQITKLLQRSSQEIKNAPTLLLGCLVSEGLNQYVDDRRNTAEWGLALHSFGAALENILLAASSMDIGAYWISAPLYAPNEVKDSLDLDDDWNPQALIALGRIDPTYLPFKRQGFDLKKYLIFC
ncbi:MAG: nitroreductase family protein [Dehalococcoidia bacterium]|jgi:coenzyme F420-0:L-glutamate ligase/coenzyme F420-1:gamma-L-glutamate ligase|nr:nitroreductase family protein [Dehalococcoidia bacterium]